MKEDILTPDKANADIPRRAGVPAEGQRPGLSRPCGSATSSSAAAPCPRGWATASARRRGCPTARRRRSRPSPRPGGHAPPSTRSANPVNIDKVDKAVDGGAGAVPERRPDADGTGRRQEGVPGSPESGPDRRRGDRRADRVEPAPGPDVRPRAELEKRIAALTPDEVQGRVPQARRPEEAGHHPGGGLQEVGGPGQKKSPGPYGPGLSDSAN